MGDLLFLIDLKMTLFSKSRSSYQNLRFNDVNFFLKISMTFNKLLIQLFSFNVTTRSPNLLGYYLTNSYFELKLHTIAGTGFHCIVLLPAVYETCTVCCVFQPANGCIADCLLVKIICLKASFWGLFRAS